jgi:hypothetical protein
MNTRGLMKNYSIQWINKWLLSSCLLAFCDSYAQQVTPNRSLQGSRLQQYNRPEGQAVFVQPPYGSSVYTEYQYSPVPRDSNRLPSYTTNQSVFVQQPYGLTSQTRVIPFPTTDQNSLPTTASRYATPMDFPSTTSAAYPFGTADYSATSPYPTTVQLPSNNPMQPNPTFTRTDTYPYMNVQPSPQVPVTQSTSTYNPYGSSGTYPINSYPTITTPNQNGYSAGAGTTNTYNNYPQNSNPVSNYPVTPTPSGNYPTSPSQPAYPY